MNPLHAIEELCAVHSAHTVLTTDGDGAPVSLEVCRGCGEKHPCASRRILDQVVPE